MRTNPKIAGTTHNVFGIQTGVPIMFLIKKDKKEGQCIIEYVSMHDEWRKEEKLGWLKNNPLEKIHFESIHPDKSNNWINLSDDNDWNSLLPIADKNVKLGRSKEAVFELFSLGVVTARDEWVYDDNEMFLVKKVNFLINHYNQDVEKHQGKSKDEIRNSVDYSIKWTRAIKNDLEKGKQYKYDKDLIIDSIYRPFIKKRLYFSKQLNEMQYLLPKVFANENIVIAFSGEGSSKPFQTLIQNKPYNHDLLEKTQCLPLYRYDNSGNKTENITDWGLTQFVNHYQDDKITKEDIFNYSYAVLHNPAYRKKYELNLKREFPRLPFYEDFRQWVAWGKALMDLHINYETVEPFALTEHQYEVKAEAKRQKEMFSMVEEPEALFTRKPKVKVKLKADKAAGIIDIDELTFLSDVPAEAWEYKLGNRSALEWILDQYKEKKPGDPTIAEKFNTYLFADYKEKVIDLLKRVCTVSVETVSIIKQMELVH